jgi:hypothetical protein
MKNYKHVSRSRVISVAAIVTSALAHPAFHQQTVT